MKEMEMELPQKDDNGMVARVKRMHFYSVREEFIIIWNFHEQFLVDYEERLVRRLRNQAKIGKFNRMTNSRSPLTIVLKCVCVLMGNFVNFLNFSG